MTALHTLTLVALAATAALGQSPARPPIVYAQDVTGRCKQLLDTLPQPPAEPSGTFKPDCDSAAYYFGIGRPVDYAAARQCAYVERAHSDANNPDIFAGPGVLSMIYANGHGVKPDLELAKRFTCEGWAAPAELEGRLDILDNDRKTNTVAKFDLCETATSGFSEGWCANIDSRLNQVRRAKNIKLIVDKLPASALPAFHALQSAENDFDDLRSGNEVDLSGTGRAAFESMEQDTLRDQFLINLQRLTAPSFTSPVPLPAAERHLNAAYKALKLSMPPKEFSASIIYGTLGFEGVQKTQRAWLTLRDAWVGFAQAIQAPATSAQVAAVITEQRAHQLKSLNLNQLSVR